MSKEKLESDMKRFDDWELIPQNYFDDMGKGLEKDLKAELRSQVDDMFMHLTTSMYQHSNTAFLVWLEELIQNAFVSLTFNDSGRIEVHCSLIPDDYDKQFIVKMQLDDEIESYLGMEDDDRKRMAAALREAADRLDP